MVATKRKMDFTNVKEGGGFNPRHVKSGDYRMKILKVEDGESKAGNSQWVFTIQREGDKRATYPYYVGCDDDKQAWKIRKLLIAAGIPVPKKLVMVDPNKLVGKTIGAFLDDDEYEGRMKSVIADTFPVSEIDNDEDEDEAPARKPKARVVEDDEDDDVDLDEEDDEEDEEEPPPPPRKKAAAKKVPAKKAAPKRRQPEPEDDEDDDDLEIDEL